MKTYTFEVAEHEEFGGLGFRPKWYPQGDPLGGMGVAHDILEHFPKDDGSAEGEYMALGASLFIRGQGGYPMNGTSEQNIASDLPTVWGVQSYVRDCALSKDPDLMERAREAVGHFRKEGTYMDRDQRPSEESYERIARWIAKGYQRARKRYAKQGASRITWDLFKPIEDAAEKALKYADEGMILTVCVDFKNVKVRVDCDYPAEEA